MSVLDELKKLDEQRAKLLDKAKADALKKAEAAISELNDLGFNFELVERARKAASGSRTGSRKPKDEPCPICGFKTEPPHDKRSHRTQEPKRPFTDAELKQRNMRKVS